MKLKIKNTQNRRILVLFIIAVALCLTAVGCAAQAPQGWSGCTSNGTNIYYGSMDSRIICFNPDSRGRGLTFPDKEKGEWYALIRGPVSSGGMCGFGCAPATASKVAIYSTPVVADELVYVATYFGKVHAYNTVTGAERWIYPRDMGDSMGGIVGNIVLAENTLYITSSSGYIYALEMEYGDKKWEFNTGGRIWTASVYSDGKVYASNYDGKLFALSGKDGSLIWEIELPASSSSSPEVYKNKIIIGTFDHYLYAINQLDGQIEWQFKGNGWFWAQVIVDDDIIYACCLDGNIYAINADSGDLIWQYDSGAAISSRPVLIDNWLVAVNEKGDLHIINSDGGVFKQVVALGNKIDAPLYALGDIVYAHGRDDYVYAVDTASGQMMWKFKAEMQ